MFVLCVNLLCSTRVETLFFVQKIGYHNFDQQSKFSYDQLLSIQSKITKIL